MAEYASNFADNTWSQIIEACKKNEVPTTWTVGNQKTMSINGRDYAIVTETENVTTAGVSAGR